MSATSADDDRCATPVCLRAVQDDGDLLDTLAAGHTPKPPHDVVTALLIRWRDSCGLRNTAA